jgi:hypothetical protein
MIINSADFINGYNRLTVLVRGISELAEKGEAIIMYEAAARRFISELDGSSLEALRSSSFSMSSQTWERYVSMIRWLDLAESALLRAQAAKGLFARIRSMFRDGRRRRSKRRAVRK